MTVEQDQAGPLTLAIDCGGTGIKGSVLDPAGKMITERIRVRTPYPLPPSRFVGLISELASRLPKANRATIGMPGMIRHGVVVATPHYVTRGGPHTAVDSRLAKAWRGFDVGYTLETELAIPTLVLNDAEVAGAGAITGFGFEVMLTLGTGLGNAMFDNGVLLPHLEISRAPVRRSRIYDEYIGDRARKRLGEASWSLRVRQVLQGLWPMLHWDHLYLGGGNGRRMRGRDLDRLGSNVSVVPNDIGIVGGVRAWEVTMLRSTAAVQAEHLAEDSPAQLAALVDALIEGPEPGEPTAGP